MGFFELISRLLRGAWFGSVVWLALTAVIIVWDLIRWFTDGNNPGRDEFATHAVIVLFYSFPAAVGVLVAGIVPRTGLSIYRRLGGIGLLAFCIVAFLTLDFLAIKYR